LTEPTLLEMSGYGSSGLSSVFVQTPAESSLITNGSQDAQQRAAQGACIIVVGKGLCGCPLC